MSDQDDLAPPPEDTLTLVRAPNGGWLVLHDNHIEAALSGARELAQWIEDTLAPLEDRPVLEPLPQVIVEQRPVHRPIWRILTGGKP